MKQLTQALINVMSEVSNIDKSMTVGAGYNSYKGVSDKDVKTGIRKSMIKNGLAIVPTDIQSEIKINRWEEEYKGVLKQKQSVLAEVITTYTLLHISGESINIKGYGHGVDSQDKAAGKATTYALKYALLYLGLIPTGHIDDADKVHSNDHPTPEKKIVASNPKAKVEPTKEQFEAMKGALEKGVSVDSVKKALQSKYILNSEQEKIIKPLLK